jgi:uncharacterized Tic20 family protein
VKRNPRGDTLKRLATALQITPDELLDWAEEEDTTTLVLLNISALSFIVFPLLGIIIPLVIWISKKDKIKDLNITGKKLLNFQISWSIVQLLMLTSTFLVMLRNPYNFRITSGIGSVEPLIFMAGPIMYLINGGLIIINAYRSYNNIPVIYQPAIPFIR